MLSMSLPRYITPNATWSVTRRCSERRHFLTPTTVFVIQVFLYCMSYPAAFFGIQIHAFCVMSNHYHLILTDLYGLLPRYMEWLNKYVAKVMNAHLGRWENFWAPGSYDCVRLQTPEDILDKMAYAIANPVSAGLVAKALMWPGAVSLPGDYAGKRWTTPRPAKFFREDGKMPEKVRLVLTRPPGFEHLSAEAFQTLLEERVAKREAEMTEKYNGRFLGAAKIRRQKPTDSPKTKAPRRKLNPRIAGKNREVRIRAIRQLVTFWHEYRAARKKWLAGGEALFPFGTYWLRIHAKVRVAKPPD